MSIPKKSKYLIIGAGIHGLSTAWKLAEMLIEKGETVKYSKKWKKTKHIDPKNRAAPQSL